MRMFRQGIVLALLCLVSLVAIAQDAGFPIVGEPTAPDESLIPAAEGRIDQNTYGVTDYSDNTVNAYEFLPGDGPGAWSYSSGGRVPEDNNQYLAPLNLPSGSLVVGIELEACDASTLNRLRAGLLQCPSPVASNCAFITTVNTGAANADVPGCGYFVSANPNYTIDNHNVMYWLSMSLDGTPGDIPANPTRYASVRVRYQLQISPTPTTATFPLDVPVGHPLHRFVEALARSGITSGCGPGRYCPDAPITRGQMAVFLSAALGLHWVP